MSESWQPPRTSHKFERLRIGVASAFVVLVTVIAAASALMRYGSNGRTTDQIEELAPAQFGLVLGTGRVRGTGADSPVFLARVAAAAAVFKAHKVNYLIASGYRVGGGRATGDYDEPEDVRAALFDLGVPNERVIIDSGSYRTRDSILRIRCFTAEKRVIVITQRAHLARALFIGWANGRHDSGFVAEDPPPDLAVQDNRLEIFARLLALVDIFRLRTPSCGG